VINYSSKNKCSPKNVSFYLQKHHVIFGCSADVAEKLPQTSRIQLSASNIFFLFVKTWSLKVCFVVRGMLSKDNICVNKVDI